jgi:replicative DNA helicase
VGGALSQYIALGFSLFPVREKIPLTRNGFKDAVKAPEDIARLFDQHPGAGVAIATGVASGNLLVVDIDERHGGDDSLVDLKRELGGLPETACCSTPSGGQHFYFRLPPGVHVRSSVDFRPGIDIRADGGYVVAPPSRGYAWDVALDSAPIADAPARLIELLVERKDKKDADGTSWSAGGFILPDRIESGGRDNTLTRFAGQLRRGGLDTETIFAMLQHVNLERCVPPLENKDIKRIARSIGTRPIQEQASDLVDKVVNAVDQGDPIPGFFDRAAIEAELERYAKLDIVTTGFPLLDRYLGGGLWSTQTAVLIAPTGSGKTTIAMQIARKVCERRPVLVWTMEMAPPILAARVASQESGDNYLDVLLDEDVRRRNAPLMPAGLYYYGGRDLEAVVKAAKRVHGIHEGKPPLLIIDYMQKAPGQGDDPRHRLTEISETLRTLALRLDCPLLVISSASRAGATLLRESHKHAPEELAQTGKESGDIEYDANAVITLGLLADETGEDDGTGWRKAVLTVAKARFGRARQLAYEFNGKQGLWRELGDWKHEDGGDGTEPISLRAQLEDDEGNVLAVLRELGGICRTRTALVTAVRGMRRQRVFGAIDRLVAVGVVEDLPTGGLRITE